MPHAVEYRPLARELASLPLSATCADLASVLESSAACQPEAKARLVAAVRELPPAAEWLRGLFVVCDVLQRDNARFVPALLMDWALEEV